MMSALDAISISQTSSSIPFKPTTSVGKAIYAIYATIVAPLRSSSCAVRGGGSPMSGPRTTDGLAVRVVTA